MPILYELNAAISDAISVAIAGGADGVVAVPCPSRCYVNRLVIAQVDGTLVNFVANVYYRALPAAGIGLEYEGYTIPAEAFKIMPDQIGTAGLSTFDTDTISNTVGHRIEDTVPIANGGIHIRITPAGTGAKWFAVIVTTSEA